MTGSGRTGSAGQGQGGQGQGERVRGAGVRGAGAREDGGRREGYGRRGAARQREGAGGRVGSGKGHRDMTKARMDSKAGQQRTNTKKHGGGRN